MADAVSSYRDLLVWQWPRDERFGLISQVRRATVSVASNIAEGAARRSTGEFIQFIGMAQGSLAEAETQLVLAERLGYLTNANAKTLLDASAEISRMLAALKASLVRRKNTPH